VDVLEEWGSRLINGKFNRIDLDVVPEGMNSFDIFPGCYDDWIMQERERIRSKMIRAVEALSRELCQEGRTAKAIEAAMTVVHADPLRETAQRLLIEAYLAEGNLADARHAYNQYRCLLKRELNVSPQPGLVALVFR
jgi:DNA-binding SARP family transcriptional activator